MTPSPDLIRELQASRPAAPPELRARVREIAREESTRVPVWSRLRLPARRTVLVALPAARARARERRRDRALPLRRQRASGP